MNNAGWSVPNFLLKDTDRSRWQRLVDVNLFATIECTQAVLPLMQRQGGRGGSIVMIASDAAFGQLRQGGVYGATKAAQVALARTVAKEFGRDGVRCNVVCPGLVVPEVGRGDRRGESVVGGAEIFDEAQVASIEKSLPLRRLTSATDIADTVVFLSSELRSRQTTADPVGQRRIRDAVIGGEAADSMSTMAKKTPQRQGRCLTRAAPGGGRAGVEREGGTPGPAVRRRQDRRGCRCPRSTTTSNPGSS